MWADFTNRVRLHMETLLQQLAEAKAARHAIMVGNAVREIRDSTGESVAYARANLSALNAYIRELEGEIAALATDTPLRRGPFTPTFGCA